MGPLPSDDEIARWIAANGVTRCPTAYAEVTSAEISAEDRQQHVARGIDPVGDAWRKSWTRPTSLNQRRVKILEERIASAVSRPKRGRNRIEFTPEMDATIIRMWTSGKPVRGEIERAMSEMVIYRRMDELGIARRRARRTG